jgi:hypothetical protein
MGGGPPLAVAAGSAPADVDQRVDLASEVHFCGVSIPGRH